MKKKISALLLSLALCAGLLAGCGTGETAEAPSDTDVQQVDSLKIAFSPYADADLISESTEPLEELLREHSPLHQAAAMPDIPYLFIHGDADRSVNKGRHSDRMAEELRRLGRRVEYVEVPRMGHGVNLPLSVSLKRLEFIAGLL